MARVDDDSWDPAVGAEYFVRVVDNERFLADEGDNPVETGLIDILAAHT